ncbi:MAG: DMT family transporter, partial [Pseudomonadota bacterium]
MAQPNPAARAYGQIVACAFLISTGAAVIKATSFSAWEIVGWRGLFCAPFLLLLCRPNRKSWGTFILPAALAHAATAICFISAQKMTTAATGIFLHYTSPIYVILLSPWLLDERFEKKDFVYLAIVMGGMGLLLVSPGEASATAPRPVLGAVVAALGGLSWGLLAMFMRKLARDESEGSDAT